MSNSGSSFVTYCIKFWITVLCLCFYTPYNVKIATPNCTKMHYLKWRITNFFVGEGGGTAPQTPEGVWGQCPPHPHPGPHSPLPLAPSAPWRSCLPWAIATCHCETLCWSVMCSVHCLIVSRKSRTLVSKLQPIVSICSVSLMEQSSHFPPCSMLINKLHHTAVHHHAVFHNSLLTCLMMSSILITNLISSPSLILRSLQSVSWTDSMKYWNPVFGSFWRLKYWRMWQIKSAQLVSGHTLK